jgi:hypothetical protein
MCRKLKIIKGKIKEFRIKCKKIDIYRRKLEKKQDNEN